MPAPPRDERHPCAAREDESRPSHSSAGRASPPILVERSAFGDSAGFRRGAGGRRGDRVAGGRGTVLGGISARFTGGQLVRDRTVRRLHRRMLQDLVKSFDCSCEGDERRAEWVRGGFARGHLLLASKRGL